MASVSYFPVSFFGNGFDVMSMRNNQICGITSKFLINERHRSRRGRFVVTAKMRKATKHEYPWSGVTDFDPNVKGGILSYLSDFKPLKEKPKQITLEFEKPLLNIEKNLSEVRKMAEDTGLDFSHQILTLEEKYKQALKDLYSNLKPMQRVHIARHPNRPTCLDHIFSMTEKFVELHGDRAGYDDPAMVTGLGNIDGKTYMFIGHQKGRNTKENIRRNFGMPTPHGYRKALRLMKYADHHGFPIVTLIDTPGAYADIKSEHLGQGEAIAVNLREMFGLSVPIVSIVIGEGGSGGALAIACANKLLMLENAVFYVASPEACAAILWKSAKAAPKAAEALKITAPELCKLGIADGIIPEPLGGAHADPAWTSQQLKIAITQAMNELSQMDGEALMEHRASKFRRMGPCGDGPSLDKSVELRDDDADREPSPFHVLEEEVERLKSKIMDNRNPSEASPESELNAMMDKVRMDVQIEYSRAVEATRSEDKITAANEQLRRASEAGEPDFAERAKRLKSEVEDAISAAPNFDTLQQKLGIMKNLSEYISDMEDGKTKAEISTMYRRVVDGPDMREKVEAVNSSIRASGAQSFEELDEEVKGVVVALQREIFSEVSKRLGREPGTEIKPVDPRVKTLINKKPELRLELEELREGVGRRMDEIMESQAVKSKMELLSFKMEREKTSPSEGLKAEIEGLRKEIMEHIDMAMDNSSELLEKHKRLQNDISRGVGGGDFGGYQEWNLNQGIQQLGDPDAHFCLDSIIQSCSSL